MGKVVLITGAARKGRVGEALAREFHERGYDVAIHYGHSENDAAQLADELNVLRSGSAKIFQANLCSDDLTAVAENLIQSVASAFGGLSILINSAAQFEESNPANPDLAQIERLNRVNAIAPYLLTTCFNQWLEKNPNKAPGFSINVSDNYIASPNAELISYNGSKQYLECLIRQSAVSCSRLKVFGVAPGPMLAATTVEHQAIPYEGTDILIEKIFCLINGSEYKSGAIVKATNTSGMYSADFLTKPGPA